MVWLKKKLKMDSRFQPLERDLREVVSRYVSLVKRSSFKDSEIDALRKEKEALLQCNKQLNLSVESKTKEVRELEQRVEDTATVLNNTKVAFKQEVEGLKILHENNVKSIRMQLSDHVQSLIRNHETNCEERCIEVIVLRDKNLALSGKNAALIGDIEKIKEERDKQLNQYEDMLCHEKREVILNKREIERLREILYRKTQTPVNNDQLGQHPEEIRPNGTGTNRPQTETSLSSSSAPTAPKPVDDDLVLIERSAQERNIRKTTVKKCFTPDKRRKRYTEESDQDCVIISPQRSSRQRDVVIPASTAVGDETASKERLQTARPKKMKLFTHSDSLVLLDLDDVDDVRIHSRDTSNKSLTT